MTLKDKKIEPTKVELEILKILWHFGPSTVRFVNDQLSISRGVQYTSTLKQMQIMTQKELLIRDESEMKHVYKPAMEELKAKSFLLDRFVSLIYDGSVSGLLQQLLGNHKPTEEEMKIIQDVLDKHNKN